MKTLFFLFIVILLSSNNSYSQQNPRIDKKIFFSTLEGCESAKKDLKIAEKYYKAGRGTFDEALKHYLKVYQYNSNSHALNYKIAICYLGTSNKKASLSYFLKSSPEISKDYYLGLGRAYQYNLLFEDAKNSYGKYLESLKPWDQRDAQKLYSQLVAECEVGKEILKDSVAAFIINLGPIINTYYDDYGAVLNPGETTMYFTSKRPEEEPGKRVSRFKYKERVLQANNNAISQPAESVEGISKMENRVNTSVSGFSHNEERLFFYKGEIQNGRIFSSALVNGTWKKAKPVKGRVNHIAYKETTISIDDSLNAYFVSDRKGGFGGKDIWMTSLNRESIRNKPINSGQLINTPYDEECVYVTADGNTMYFSSNGRKGMGGFDVYKSERGSDGIWGEPKNMGYPINSTADELFYYPTKDTMVATYSTIRGDSYGGLDIYKIQLDPRIPFKLIGTVTDVKTGKIIPASLNVYDGITEKLIKSVKVDSLAEIFILELDDVGNYFIQIDYEGYKSVTETIICPEKKHATVNQDFKLEALNNPFTLVGRITDVDNGTPINASLTFKLAALPDSVIGRAVSVGSTGKYTISFEDKFDMIIQINAKDYFSIDEPLSTVNEVESIISKNISLKRSRIDYTLTGIIYDEDSVNRVHAALSFFHPGEVDPFAIVVSDSMTGKYSITINEKGPFMIEVEANGYFYANEIYQFPDSITFTAKNFNLKKMDVGIKIVIDNILFNTGKATLKTESFSELNKFAILLIKNEKVRIEISGHTDNVGSATVNKRISKERALTVKNYLVSRGVEQDRIEYEGYGFSQPIAPNDTEEGRAMNRRVELKILD